MCLRVTCPVLCVGHGRDGRGKAGGTKVTLTSGRAEGEKRQNDGKNSYRPRDDNEETAGNGRKGKACLKMKCNSLGLLASFTPGHQRQNLSSVHFAQIFIMNPQTLPRNNLTNLQFALTLRPRSPALRTRTPSTARCVRRSFAHSFLASQFRSKRNEKRGESWRANERTPSEQNSALVLRQSESEFRVF